MFNDNKKVTFYVSFNNKKTLIINTYNMYTATGFLSSPAYPQSNHTLSCCCAISLQIKIMKTEQKLPRVQRLRC